MKNGPDVVDVDQSAADPVPVDLDQVAAKAATTATAAKRHAKDAAELVEALREKVRNGEDVTPAEIASARDVAEHAELRATAAARQAEATKVAARRSKLDTLAADLFAHDADPDAFERALTDMEQALAAFCELFAKRQEVVRGFRDRMIELGVEAFDNRRPPGHGRQEDAGLVWGRPGYGGSDVGVRGRVLRAVDAGPYVAAVVHRAAGRYQLSASGRSLGSTVPDLYGLNGPHDVHAYLRSQV